MKFKVKELDVKDLKSTDDIYNIFIENANNTHESICKAIKNLQDLKYNITKTIFIFDVSFSIIQLILYSRTSAIAAILIGCVCLILFLIIHCLYRLTLYRLKQTYCNVTAGALSNMLCAYCEYNNIDPSDDSISKLVNKCADYTVEKIKEIKYGCYR